MIPRHEADGFLPVGVHRATWVDVVERFGWNRRRAVLVGNLHKVLSHIAEAGCERAMISGSFVTTKAMPGDVDVAWDLRNVNPDLLNEAFTHFGGIAEIWTMTGCHLYPALATEASTGLPFAFFFMLRKGGQPRRAGVIGIDLTEWEY